MKIWVADHNNVMADISKKFEVVSDATQAERILLWNEVNPVEKGIISWARGKKIPTIVFQHGRRGSSKYYPPFNEKITADKYLAWGEKDKADLIGVGNDPKKIRVVGTTIFSHLKDRVPHKGINVVFSPEHWDCPLEENTLTRKKLRQIKNVHIITKTIDSPSMDGIAFDNPVYSNRSEEKHLDVCADVLSAADVVVGISESTFELLAQSLDIPVVIMDEWTPKPFGRDTRYHTYRRIISRASMRSSMNDLVDSVNTAILDPQLLSKERGEIVVEDGGKGLNSLDLIVKEIYATKLS